MEFLDGIPIRPCVRCGECCKASACGFGFYSRELSQCHYLLQESAVGDMPTYVCSLADHIMEDPTSEISPAFGAGCCRTIGNEARDRIVAVTLKTEKA